VAELGWGFVQLRYDRSFPEMKKARSTKDRPYLGTRRLSRN